MERWSIVKFWLLEFCDSNDVASLEAVGRRLGAARDVTPDIKAALRPVYTWLLDAAKKESHPKPVATIEDVATHYDTGGLRHAN